MRSSRVLDTIKCIKFLNVLLAGSKFIHASRLSAASQCLLGAANRSCSYVHSGTMSKPLGCIAMRRGYTHWVCICHSNSRPAAKAPTVDQCGMNLTVKRPKYCHSAVFEMLHDLLHLLNWEGFLPARIGRGLPCSCRTFLPEIGES